MNTSPPEWAIRTEADRQALKAGYYWDNDQAERIIRFAEAYLAPKFTAGEFTLFDWQRRFLMSLYGWRRPDGGRRFRTALLHVPKKNGKTLLVACIAAYELFAAPVASPLVCSASTTRDNAKQVFEHLVACINRNAKLKSAAKAVEYQKRIKAPKRDGEYRALSADAPNAEGLNCSAVIVDEAHAHRSPRLFRTLEYAMIGRSDGLMVVISTAGDDLTHWYYGLVVRGRNVLAGTDTDPTFYAEVYEADPEKDDVDDPATWRKANPSLDCYAGFTSEAFGHQLAAAKSNTSDRLSFERYRLNIFRAPEAEAWVDLTVWDRLPRAPSDTELRGRKCWLGFDGSQTTDPTSLAAVWLLDGRRFAVRSWAWVAEGGVRKREASNLPKYAQFIAEGAMVMTAGDLIDKSLCRAKILELASAFDVQALVMDPNGHLVFGAELAGQGFEVYRQPQNFKHFNDPTKEFQIAVAEGRVLHDGNGWLRWCLHSVRLGQDDYDNVRPVKAKSVDHIDGAIAVLMAFALANQAAHAPPPKPSVYEDRGVLVM